MASEQMIEQVKAYIGTTEDVDVFIDVATLQITRLVADRAPEPIFNQAVVELSSELFHRKSAPNGIAQFNTFDGSAIRVARDPMTIVYPMLRPYMGWAA